MKRCLHFLKFWPVIWLALLLSLFLLQALNLAPDGSAMDIRHVYESPSNEHWFGLDSMGRDLFLRVLGGSGLSISISLSSLFFILIMALTMGGLSGWFGGIVDRLLMSFLEIWSSIPSFMLYVTMALIFEKSTHHHWVVILALALTGWGRIARVVRGEILQLKRENYIKATVGLGSPLLFLLKNHIIPHLTPRLFLLSLFQLPSLIIAESFLSYIGLGVQPPAVSLGILLHEGWKSIQVYPHLALAPASILFSMVWAIHVLASELEIKAKS